MQLEHCEVVGGAETCHGHPQTGGTGGTLSLVAPDHSHPAHLSVTLTATGTDGLVGTATVRLDPETSVLTLASAPTGLRVGFDSEVVTAPATRTVIVGSRHCVSASTQTSAGARYAFARWSDEGTATHDVVAGSQAATLTATFTRTGRTVVLAPLADAEARQQSTDGVVLASRQAATTGSRPRLTVTIQGP